MLYAYHEQLHTLSKNMLYWTDAASKMLSYFDQGSSKLLVNNQIVAGFEVFNRLVRQYEKPAFNLTQTAENLTVTEKIISSKAFCHLIHFERTNPAGEIVKGRAKILLVSPMSGHHATLLRDTVKALIDTHDVYVTDWQNAREVPMSEGSFSFDDYVSYVLQFIQILSEQERIHVMAVCQPTVPVLAAISLMSQNNNSLRPLSMTLMGGPIDVRAAPTDVTRFATKHSLQWFKNHVISQVPYNYAGAGRQVYPGFLQHMAFVSMNPGRHWNAHLDFFHHLIEGDQSSADSHRRFYDEYNAVADLPAEFYLDTIEKVFQNADLARGTLVVSGVKVDPSAITDVALLTVEGGRDDISAPEQTTAAHILCSALPKEKQAKLFMETAGHYGVFSGSLWRKSIAPEIKKFMAAHSNNELV